MILLASIGLCQIIIWGSIFKKPRDYLKKKYILLNMLFSCSMCVGFWTGLFFGLLDYAKSKDLITLACMPFASSCMSWLFDSLIDYLHAQSTFYEKRIK